MLFVVVLFSGATVLPIVLLVWLAAAVAWAVAERRLRNSRRPERPVNGSVTLGDSELPSPPR
jgi:hypothetical protein